MHALLERPGAVAFLVANFGEFSQMWAILSILGHPQGATRCDYYINSRGEGATLCIGGSSILMQLCATGLQTDCMVVCAGPVVRLPDSHVPMALGYGLPPM